MADKIKREVRARMAKTGERYTTARAHVLRLQGQTAEPLPVMEAGDLPGGRPSDVPTEELIELFNNYLEGAGNPWRLDLEEMTLELEGERYAVDLEQCRTSAETLDWIIQVATKSWATDAVIAGLVRALDILIEPDINLCTDGIDHSRNDWLPEDIEQNLRWSGVILRGSSDAGATRYVAGP